MRRRPTVTARRPPPSRLAPETLAAARQDGALEGLAWLGREPEAKASLAYRFLRLAARALLFGVFGFHITMLRSSCCGVCYLLMVV